jgi:hypothetical protein
MRTVMISAAALSIALPVVAHSQHAASLATPCASPFPYGPEQFLEKLLVVADEVDPDAVAAKFQQVFAMKLRFEARKPPRFPTYEATECEWYAPVLIVPMPVVEPKPSPQVRTLLSVGSRLQTLLFRGSTADQCLSPRLAQKSLAAAGWQGGVVPTDTINYLYRKGHAELSFAAIGVQAAGPVVACVPEITIRYH